MLRYSLSMAFLAVVSFCPLRVVHGDDKKAWQEAELKKFGGRWTTYREEKNDQEVRRSWVELEFADGKMEVFILDEKKKEIWRGPPLKAMGIEQVGFARLTLGYGERKIAEVYYDFVGEKIILIGRIGSRPFEGFILSGEYKRAEKPK